MTKKSFLTPDEFRQCAETMRAIQFTCEHKRVTTSSQWFGPHLIEVRQCCNCMMYDPGGVGFTPAAALESQPSAAGQAAREPINEKRPPFPKE